MDVNEIIRYRFCYSRVFLDEISKAQTPRTPVAAYLTNHELAALLGFRHSIINLRHRVYALIVNLYRLRIGTYCECKRKD